MGLISCKVVYELKIPALYVQERFGQVVSILNWCIDF
jgi:hypothetical protein